ncbi:MAG: formylglycine-generating enzyme family protein [Terriglobales bacterium]|jgi:formylglycine-generating enzyme required for sulfatase activity
MRRLFIICLLAFGAVGIYAQNAAPKPATAPSAPATPTTAAATVSTAPPAATKVNPKDGLTYVWIAPGKFQMGCAANDQDCGDDEKPLHEVTISKGFYIGQTLVTQAAYQKVMGSNPSRFHGEKMPLPAENMPWNDAVAYCTAVGMRLPTEAEWEYAARAGDTGPRYGNLDAIAWYSQNSNGTTRPVGKKLPNAWKLSDMLGNVWEWTADRYDKDYYAHSEKQDPKGAADGEDRAVRGGCWNSSADIVRASQRVSTESTSHGANVGFRCAGD